MVMREDREAGRLGWLTGVVLIVVLVFGLFSSAVGLVTDKGRALLAAVHWREVLDGRTTAALSRFLNEELIGGHALATLARSIDWFVVGDLGPQVRRGCENWLFLREELDIHPQGQAAIARRAAMAVALSGRLQAKGIRLVVAVAPDKSRIKADALCGLSRPASLARRFDDFTASLTGGGVDTVDLRTVLAGAAEGGYWRTDTHWSEAGAEASARAIAAHLEAEGAAPPRGADVPVSRGEVKERVGDLIRLAGLDGVSPPLRPEGDRVAAASITMPAIVADDLFGEMSGPPVAVVGSSFSRNGNFVGFVAATLASPVADMARDGAGFAGAMVPYLADGAFTATPPQVLIWEIPERVLDTPLTPQEGEWEARLAAGGL